MTMKPVIKKGIILLLAVCLLTTATFAYNLLTNYSNFNSNTVYYYYDQQGTVNHYTQVVKGTVRWNQSGANILLYSGTANSNNIYISSGDYGAVSWAGRCSNPTWYMPNSAIINLNDYSLTSSDLALNCVEHEIGHAYGLDHNNQTNSLGQGIHIVYEYNVDYILYPSSDDVAGVNYRY